jgi:hypothetical protein
MMDKGSAELKCDVSPKRPRCYWVKLLLCLRLQLRHNCARPGPSHPPSPGDTRSPSPLPTMRRSVLAILPQLVRGNAAATAVAASSPALQHLGSRLSQQLRAFADDASLKVRGRGVFGWRQRCGGRNQRISASQPPTHPACLARRRQHCMTSTWHTEVSCAWEERRSRAARCLRQPCRHVVAVSPPAANGGAWQDDSLCSRRELAAEGHWQHGIVPACSGG